MNYSSQPGMVGTSELQIRPTITRLSALSRAFAEFAEFSKEAESRIRDETGLFVKKKKKKQLFKRNEEIQFRGRVSAYKLICLVSKRIQASLKNGTKFSDRFVRGNARNLTRKVGETAPTPTS